MSIVTVVAMAVGTAVVVVTVVTAPVAPRREETRIRVVGTEAIGAEVVRDRRAVGVVVAVARFSVAARVALIAAVVNRLAHPVDVMAGVSRVAWPAETEVEEQAAHVEGDAHGEDSCFGRGSGENRRQGDNCENDQCFLHLRYLLFRAISRRMPGWKRHVSIGYQSAPSRNRPLERTGHTVGRFDRPRARDRLGLLGMRRLGPRLRASRAKRKRTAKRLSARWWRTPWPELSSQP